MILTNDVGWIHPLTHPSFKRSCQYEVVVEGFPKPEVLEQLSTGIVLPGERVACQPCSISIVDEDQRSGLSLLDVLLDETMPEQLSRMLEDVAGCRVRGVKRIAFGPVRLRGLRRGQWRELTLGEVDKLKSACSRRSPNGTAVSREEAIRRTRPSDPARAVLTSGVGRGVGKNRSGLTSKHSRVTSASKSGATAARGGRTSSSHSSNSFSRKGLNARSDGRSSSTACGSTRSSHRSSGISSSSSSSSTGGYSKDRRVVGRGSGSPGRSNR